MDFDDLDDEVEARLAAGEQVAGLVIENHQPRQGEELPLVKRAIAKSSKVALDIFLPERARKEIPPWNGEDEKEKKPVVRLLCIHGVADSYQQEWFRFVHDAPPFVEVVVHEFPGHGQRESEKILGSLEELTNDAFEAFREAMDTGSFALLGHSIGALIVTALAKRARAELGVEPVFVFMLERGAPTYPLFTEKGYDMLKNDREALMEIWQPLVLTLYKSGSEIGARTMELWQKGWFVENECLDPGYHIFRCPMLALHADSTVRNYTDLETCDEATRQVLESKIPTAANLQYKDDEGKLFTGHFPLFSYADWEQWTEHSAGCKIVECMKADHMTIKSNSISKNTIFSALKRVVDQW